PAPRPRRRRIQGVDLAIFLRGAALLAVTGVCIAAFVMQLTGRLNARAPLALRDFVNRNQLTPRARTQMLAWLGAGGVRGPLLAPGLYLWRRRRSVPTARASRVMRTGRLVWPLMLPSLAWPLLVATEWEPLARVSGIAFVALITEVCFRSASGE